MQKLCKQGTRLIPFSSRGNLRRRETSLLVETWSAVGAADGVRTTRRWDNFALVPARHAIPPDASPVFRGRPTTTFAYCMRRAGIAARTRDTVPTAELRAARVGAGFRYDRDSATVRQRILVQLVYRPDLFCPGQSLSFSLSLSLFLSIGFGWLWVTFTRDFCSNPCPFAAQPLALKFFCPKLQRFLSCEYIEMYPGQNEWQVRLDRFYPTMSYRRVQEEKKATSYFIRLGRSLWSANQLLFEMWRAVRKWGVSISRWSILKSISRWGLVLKFGFQDTFTYVYVFFFFYYFFVICNYFYIINIYKININKINIFIYLSIYTSLFQATKIEICLRITAEFSQRRKLKIRCQCEMNKVRSNRRLNHFFFSL